MPSNIEILKIRKFRPKVGPLTPYKPPFNPINRPWDPSRSIELEEIYILVDLELRGAYLKANSCQNIVFLEFCPAKFLIPQFLISQGPDFLNSAQLLLPNLKYRL